jgi:hypothetical protein
MTPSNIRLAVLLYVYVSVSALTISAQVMLEAKSAVKGAVVGERDFLTFYPREFLRVFSPRMLHDSSGTNRALGIRVAYHLEDCDLLFAIQDEILMHYADSIKDKIRECEGDTIIVRHGDTLSTIVSRFIIAEWRYLFCNRLRSRHNTNMIPVSGEAIYPIRLYECQRIGDPIRRLMKYELDSK